jgi:hypothetical protein
MTRKMALRLAESSWWSLADGMADKNGVILGFLGIWYVRKWLKRRNGEFVVGPEWRASEKVTLGIPMLRDSSLFVEENNLDADCADKRRFYFGQWGHRKTQRIFS